MGYPLFRIIFTIYSGVFWSKNSCLALLDQILGCLAFLQKLSFQSFLVIFCGSSLWTFHKERGGKGGGYKIALYAINMPQLAIYLCINHEDNNYNDDDVNRNDADDDDN